MHRASQSAPESKSQWLARNLTPFGPRLPLDELVEELNRIYHSVEARDYDTNHAEIFEQLPPIWAEMIDRALAQLGPSPLQILDFGCGTGFEAGQILDCIPQEKIAGLTCYDLSSEMLAECRARIARRFLAARFFHQWAELLRAFELPAEGTMDRVARPNLIVSNSVLHHLPALERTMSEVAALSAPAAVWISGHEPSSRYFLNEACGAALAQFSRERRWRRVVNPRLIWNKARRMVGLRTSPAVAAAKRAFEAKLFEKEPSALLVSRLVDFHVAHDTSEASGGRGLDFRELSNRLRGAWKLLHVHTYSFMGPFYEARLPKRWQRVCRQLARDYPHDGANFFTVWTKA